MIWRLWSIKWIGCSHACCFSPEELILINSLDVFIQMQLTISRAQEQVSELDRNKDLWVSKSPWTTLWHLCLANGDTDTKVLLLTFSDSAVRTVYPQPSWGYVAPLSTPQHYFFLLKAPQPSWSWLSLLRWDRTVPTDVHPVQIVFVFLFLFFCSSGISTNISNYTNTHIWHLSHPGNLAWV